MDFFVSVWNRLQWVLSVRFEKIILQLSNKWYAVAEWYSAGLAIARSRVRIPPLPDVYQCQLSVPSLRGRLMSTSESWGVNGHDALAPYSWSCGFGWCPAEG